MTPKAENFFKVADVLRPYALWAEDDQLDIHEMDVQDVVGHKCGTTHCIAGWYYIARSDIVPKGRSIYFDAGAKLLAQDLGFVCRSDLEGWACKNPSTWGAPDGGIMFCSLKAWNNAKNLMDVVNHLIAIGNRLERQTLIYGKGAPEPKRILQPET